MQMLQYQAFMLSFGPVSPWVVLYTSSNATLSNVSLSLHTAFAERLKPALQALYAAACQRQAHALLPKPGQRVRVEQEVGQGPCPQLTNSALLF